MGRELRRFFEVRQEGIPQRNGGETGKNDLAREADLTESGERL